MTSFPTSPTTPIQHSSAHNSPRTSLLSKPKSSLQPSRHQMRSSYSFTSLLSIITSPFFLVQVLSLMLILGFLWQFVVVQLYNLEERQQHHQNQQSLLQQATYNSISSTNNINGKNDKQQHQRNDWKGYLLPFHFGTKHYGVQQLDYDLCNRAATFLPDMTLHAAVLRQSAIYFSGILKNTGNPNQRALEYFDHHNFTGTMVVGGKEEKVSVWIRRRKNFCVTDGEMCRLAFTGVISGVTKNKISIPGAQIIRNEYTDGDAEKSAIAVIKLKSRVDRVDRQFSICAFERRDDYVTSDQQRYEKVGMCVKRFREAKRQSAMSRKDLLTFLDYYKKAGISNVHLYLNSSRLLPMLKPYVDVGFVTPLIAPYVYREGENPNVDQVTMYEACKLRFIGRYSWFTAPDIDEMFYDYKGRSIPQFLHEVEQNNKRVQQERGEKPISETCYIRLGTKRAAICKNKVFVDAEMQRYSLGRSKYFIRVKDAAYMAVHDAMLNKKCYVEREIGHGADTCFLHLRNSNRISCR